jgi:hypothetical protein
MTKPRPAAGPLIAAMMNFGIRREVGVGHPELGQGAASRQGCGTWGGTISARARADGLQAAHVGAGAESAPRAGENDGPDRGVSAGLVHRVLEVEMHLAGPGIELFRTVERDCADPLRDIEQHRFIRHPGSPHVHSC